METIGECPLFQKASFTTFGRHRSNDFPVLHGSVSRLHAVLQYGKERVFVYDLSTHGTSVNGLKVPKEQFVQIKIGDKIQFGESTRNYVTTRRQSTKYANA